MIKKIIVNKPGSRWEEGEVSLERRLQAALGKRPREQGASQVLWHKEKESDRREEFLHRAKINQK